MPLIKIKFQKRNNLGYIMGEEDFMTTLEVQWKMSLCHYNSSWKLSLGNCRVFMHGFVLYYELCYVKEKP